MCLRVKNHVYCLRWNGKRYYYVHSCKTRRKKSHQRVVHWINMDPEEQKELDAKLEALELQSPL